MTEEMRCLSRVKGEEPQTVQVHRPRKASVRYCIGSARSDLNLTYSIDIQGEGPGTGEPVSDA